MGRTRARARVTEGPKRIEKVHAPSQKRNMAVTFILAWKA